MSGKFRLEAPFDAAGDQAQAIEKLVRELRGRGGRADAARGDRLGQDLHRRQGHRDAQPTDAGPVAQQDAGCAALPGVQGVLPAQRGRVLRLVLRLLPARSVRPVERHLHREGDLDQRGDRPAAPGRDAGAVRAARRADRRVGVVHLRPRRPGGLLRHAAAPRAGQLRRAWTPCSASSWRCSSSAPSSTSCPAPSGSAATCSRSTRPTTTTRVRVEFFDRTIERIRRIDPLKGSVLEEVDERLPIYPASHYVVQRRILDEALVDIRARARRAARGAQRLGQAARGAASRPAHPVRPRHAQGAAATAAGSRTTRGT